MVTEPAFFRDLAWVVVAAVLGGGLAWLTRQPLILGYVVGGMLVGPFTPGPGISDVHTFELFAEIGVILLMFSIGIEFDLADLVGVGWVALLGGPLGIGLSAVLGLGAGALLGWPLAQGLTMGLVISVASTMALVRLLMDRGELGTRHGRIMIGISLVEDLAVVVLTVLLPGLGSLEPSRLAAIALALGKAALVLVPVLWLTARVVPGLMLRVARTRNDELFLLVALAIGLATAALSQAAGLSLALGAFLAGLTISNSEYAHETLARLLPIRDVFVAVFFVTVGTLVDPFAVLDNLGTLGVLLALIVVGKFAIRTAVVSLFRHTLATSVRVGIGLAQIGEFSFVLVQVARGAGLVDERLYNTTLAASLLSILVNAFLVRVVPDWLAARRLAGAESRSPATAAGPTVLLCGFGRVGSAVGEALETFGVPYTVVERDPDVVRQLQARGLRCLFGDAAQAAVLAHAGLAHTPLVVLALPEIDRAGRALRAVRRLRPDVPVLARAHGRSEADALHRLGATEVIQPELEASATLIRHALGVLGIRGTEVGTYLTRYRSAIEQATIDAGGAAGVELPGLAEIAVGRCDVSGLSLRDARIRERFGVTVVAVRRGTEVHLNPSPDTWLHEGDVLRVFGLRSQIERFAAAVRGSRA